MTTTVGREAREARIARYLSDEKAARESLATYPESTRQRLEAWQMEQCEWFGDTILEIVAEFITIDDAIRQQAERGEVVKVGVTSPFDGSNGGFTIAVFHASEVPVGTTLYTLPTPPEAV